MRVTTRCTDRVGGGGESGLTDRGCQIHIVGLCHMASSLIRPVSCALLLAQATRASLRLCWDISSTYGQRGSWSMDGGSYYRQGRATDRAPMPAGREVQV
jgi:hypothetical protein